MEWGFGGGEGEGGGNPAMHHSAFLQAELSMHIVLSMILQRGFLIWGSARKIWLVKLPGH